MTLLEAVRESAARYRLPVCDKPDLEPDVYLFVPDTADPAVIGLAPGFYVNMATANQPLPSANQAFSNYPKTKANNA